MKFSTKAKNLISLKRLNLKKSIIPKFYYYSVEEIIKNRDLRRDAKSVLQEWTQANGLGLPKYKVLKKKGLDIFAFTKAIMSMLSRIIANYFLSTIVADHIASAIFLLSTNASPLYFQTRP